MSVIVEPICSEIEYTFLGIAVTNKSNNNVQMSVDERAEEKKARSRRRTRAITKRIVKGVFKFPLCCRPSTLDDQDEFTVTEYSKHIPYAPRKVPEALNQLVPYQAPEIRSQHIPHVQRKLPALGSQLQRKVQQSSSRRDRRTRNGSRILCKAVAWFCSPALKAPLKQTNNHSSGDHIPPNSGSTISMNGQWKIGFENATRRESPLQGWSLTGDAYLGVGEPGLHFDNREDAIAYAQKYGWAYRVEGELVKHQRNKSIGTFGWVELMRPAMRA